MDTEMELSRNEVCHVHGFYKSMAITYPLSGKIITWTQCPKCAAEEYSLQEKQNEIEVKNSIAKKLQLRGFPIRHSKKSFDDYHADTPSKKKALEATKRYSECFESNLSKGVSLVLYGLVGTGKTHLACSIGKEVFLKRHTVRFASVRRLVSEVRETWSSSSNFSESEVLRRFTNPDLLILDEVGVQNDTDSEKLILGDVISNRYDSEKPVIIISNLPLFSKKDLSVASILGDRVIDRIRETGGDRILFDWESYRGKK